MQPGRVAAKKLFFKIAYFENINYSLFKEKIV
jgi:hypothetical protein